MKISSYKELEAYKKAYECTMLIYGMTKAFPKDEIYGITSQLRRASVSISSNIAEGHRRGTKEYVHFLRVALGSSAEVETLLTLSKDLKYCDEKKFHVAYNLNVEVAKLLNYYIKNISNR